MWCDSETMGQRMISCCGYGVTIRRRILTKQEKIEGLNQYREQLEAEIAAIAEKIEELEKE